MSSLASISYQNHSLLPDGRVVMGVTERWETEERYFLFFTRLVTDNRERIYTFVLGTGHWFDSAGNVVLATDVRHLELCRVWIGNRTEKQIDEFVFGGH